MAGNKLSAYHGEGGYVQTPVLENKKRNKQNNNNTREEDYPH